MLDLNRIDYRILALPPEGEGQRHIDITNLVLSCQHEELKDELSSRLTLTVKQQKLDTGEWISTLLYLAYRIVFQYRLIPNAWIEIWRGSVYKFEQTTDSGSSIPITCYDTLYPMQQSREQIKVKKDENVSKTIERLVNKWGIPTGEVATISHAPGSEIYRNEKIGSIISNRLNKTRTQQGKGYVVRDTKGNVNVIEEASNEDVYVLDRNYVTSASDSHSIENLITRVKVFKSAPEEGETSEKIYQQDGRTEFGIIQDAIFGAEDEEDAKKQANERMEENGTPEIERKVSGPDIPSLRKGDFVKVNLSFSGDFIITGITRDPMKKTMDLTLRLQKGGA